MERCNSCKIDVMNDKGSVRFLCPKCGKQQIIRCSKCRRIVAKYNCPE